jgi:excisionase family DNA binding protein
MTENVYTPAEAGKLLKVGKAKVADMIASGQLEAVKLGYKTVRIKADSVHRILMPHSALGDAIMKACSIETVMLNQFDPDAKEH